MMWGTWKRSVATKRQSRMAAIIFLSIGVVFVGLHSLSVWRQTAYRVEADATIVNRVKYSKGIKLTVDFTANAGRSIRADFWEYSNPELHNIGDTVRIRYALGSPSIVYQAEEPVVEPAMFAIGGMLVVVGIYVVIDAWRPNGPRVPWVVWKREKRERRDTRMARPEDIPPL